MSFSVKVFAHDWFRWRWSYIKIRGSKCIILSARKQKYLYELLCQSISWWRLRFFKKRSTWGIYSQEFEFVTSFRKHFWKQACLKQLLLFHYSKVYSCYCQKKITFALLERLRATYCINQIQLSILLEHLNNIWTVLTAGAPKSQV